MLHAVRRPPSQLPLLCIRTVAVLSSPPSQHPMDHVGLLCPLGSGNLRLQSNLAVVATTLGAHVQYAVGHAKAGAGVGVPRLASPLFITRFVFCHCCCVLARRGFRSSCSTIVVVPLYPRVATPCTVPTRGHALSRRLQHSLSSPTLVSCIPFPMPPFSADSLS